MALLASHPVCNGMLWNSYDASLMPALWLSEPDVHLGHRLHGCALSLCWPFKGCVFVVTCMELNYCVT